MKKTSKIVVIIASILLGIGIILTILGLSFGGLTNAYIDSKGIHFEQNKRYQKTITIDDITDIDIKIDFINVTIVESDTNKVEIDVRKRYQPTVEVKDNKLIINSNEKGLFDFNLFSFEQEESRITIYLKNINNLNNIVLNNSFGEIKTDKLIASTVKIKNDFGDTSIKGIFDEVKVDNDFGNVDLKIGDIKKLDVDNNFGSIEFKINDNYNNYNINKDIQFGNVKVDGKRAQNKPTINNEMNLKTNFGDIEIEFFK